MRADACDLITRRTALCIGSTTVWLAHVLVLCPTALIGIAIGAGITGTTALTKSVLTVCILTTLWGTCRLLNGWHAQQIGITHEVGFANTLSVVLVASGSNATDNALTAFLAASIDADLSLLTRTRGCALICAATATREGITQITLWALASGSFTRRYTQCSLAADDILALGDTIPIGILDESHTTATPACMLICLAVGIRSTEQTGTGTKATAIQAGQVAGTILVAGARALGHSILKDAATLVWISSESLGTHALIASLLIHTVSPIGTGQMGALILVGAAQQGISLEARLAHALWWI